jgi:hypothetical protein
MRRALLSTVLVFLACPGGEAASVSSDSSSATGASTGGAATTTASTGGTPTTTGASASGTTGGEGAAGLELLGRLAGLWSGPVSMTPLGNFPLMNMDIRAASGQVLFSRVDLDASNSLRFAFEIEDHGDGPVLVYRNGGYFLGILRDSRTVLIEHTTTSWRFCSVTAQGCDYIDASFTFADDDHVVLDVKVKGVQHVYWDALREETRPLPEPFPDDTTPLAKDLPFPTMPSLRVDVTWAEPLVVDGAVWAIVTTQPCDMQFQCKHSRSLLATVSAGATSASLLIDQVHAGDYKLTAILDRNGNLDETLFPDSGDGVPIPNQAVTVAATGETVAKSAILVDL